VANDAYFGVSKQEIFSLLFAISTLVLTSDCNTKAQSNSCWTLKNLKTKCPMELE